MQLNVSINPYSWRWGDVKFIFALQLAHLSNSLFFLITEAALPPEEKGGVKAAMKVSTLIFNSSI